MRHCIHASLADAKKPARGGLWGYMDLSTSAKAFLDSLAPEGLKVGDGSDHLPIWIGVDAEAKKVYKVYASGMATGFGDGVLRLHCGALAASERFVEQLTQGKHIMLSTGRKEGPGIGLVIMECDPGAGAVETAASRMAAMVQSAAQARIRRP